MPARPGLQNKTPVTIGAFDEAFVAHFEIDLGMAKGAAAAITGDFGGIDFNHFGRFDGHGKGPISGLRDHSQAGRGGNRFDGEDREDMVPPMVKLNRIYTKTGDKGQTGLGDGSRVDKDALRVETYGTVDEANAALGVAKLSANGDFDAMLVLIQNDLFDLGADLCVPETEGEEGPHLRIVEGQVERLEHEIDAMNEKLAPLTSFVLPGGTALAAELHLARTIVRRAERLMVALAKIETVGAPALRYINRLSDHLFVMSRLANAGKDVLWVPGANRANSK